MMETPEEKSEKPGQEKKRKVEPKPGQEEKRKVELKPGQEEKRKVELKPGQEEQRKVEFKPGQEYKVIKDYTGDEGLKVLSVKKGDIVTVKKEGKEKFVECKNKSGDEGSIPKDCLQAHQMEEKKARNKITNTQLLCLGAMAVVVLGIFINKHNAGSELDEVRELIRESEKEYKNQFEIHSTVYSCLSDMDKGKRALCVLLLLYEKKCNFDQFLVNIAEISMKVLNASADTSSLINVNGGDLKGTVYSESFVEYYKQLLESARVMLINDIQLIPIDIVPKLHSFCDTIEPLVINSVILLTLKSNSARGPPISRAEETISELWGKSIQSFVLDPLSIRITDNVAVINTDMFDC